MRKKSWVLRALLPLGPVALLLFACASPHTPAMAPPSAARRAGRTVMISFDGVSGVRLARLMTQPGKLPAGGYRRLAERGFFAERSTPPAPSLTAVSHITLVTGALPERTGIVSNTMLDRMKPFPATISGFDAPIRAETLWEAARRQGRRVGSMLYPGADGKAPARTADWGMTYVNDPLAESELQTPDRSRWTEEAGSREPGSFSPSRSLTVVLGKTAHSVKFFAVDGTDDGKTNYDRLRVSTETGGGALVSPGDWFPVEVRGEPGRTGAWCKLLTLAPDLSKAEIYMGALYRNAAYPEELRRTLDDEIGFWPGRPDEEFFGADSARPEVFLEQAERFAEFLTKADLLAIARPDWDLLLLYQPEADSVQHEFLLADPRQEGYTAERSARFQGFVDRVYAMADGALDRIDRALAPADSLFAVSDHGMIPVWRQIYVNEVLRQGGFVATDAKGRVDPSSRAVAVTHSGIAHIYLNPSAPPGTLEELEKRISEFRLDGESPWDRVLRRRDAGSVGLDAPESGDLIVFNRPGTIFSSRIKPGVTVGKAAELGAHGYRATYPDLDASFVAAGPGIPHERVTQVRNQDTAARVARALGIDPPRNATSLRVSAGTSAR